MSNDITSLSSKGEYVVEPGVTFRIKIFIKSCLLREIETISIILLDISHNKADQRHSFIHAIGKIKSNVEYIVRCC